MGRFFPFLLVGGVVALVAPSLAPLLLWPARFVLAGLVDSVQTAARIPLASIGVPGMPVGLAVLYYGCLLALGVRQGPVRRAAAVLLVLVLVVWLFLIPPYGAGELAVLFLDVGQGDAAAVHTPCGRTLVIDAGLSDESWDAGRDVVLPALRELRWLPVDWFVVSHLHGDHGGGGPALVNGGVVRRLALPTKNPGALKQRDLYRELTRSAEAHGLPVQLWQRDRAYQLGCGVALKVLYPSPEKALDTKNANHHSMVFRLTYGDFSVLFTGDMEADAERLLLEWEDSRSKVLQSTVLKVAHHGSATSTTPAFLRAVNPQVAVISVGPNPHGLPAPEVVSRLAQGGAQVFRTDRHGAVMIITDGRSVQITSSFGSESARFCWHRGERPERIESSTGRVRHFVGSLHARGVPRRKAIHLRGSARTTAVYTRLLRVYGQRLQRAELPCSEAFAFR
jgi:competence protein ComEC